jgi:hypothetical protein
MPTIRKLVDAQGFHVTDLRWEVQPGVRVKATSVRGGEAITHRTRETPHRYLVTWMIDIEAVSVLDAAHQAFGHIQRKGTTANVFDVIDETAGKVFRVDLSEEA